MIKQYEIWSGDFFDYRNVEWYCISVYTGKDKAEKELKQKRKQVGENSIIKFQLLEREVKELHIPKHVLHLP
jgi:hypothetical protein